MKNSQEARETALRKDEIYTYYVAYIANGPQLPAPDVARAHIQASRDVETRTGIAELEDELLASIKTSNPEYDITSIIVISLIRMREE